MKLLVTGSRFQKDRIFVWKTLDYLHRRHLFDCVIHGDAEGTDSLAKQWAIARGIHQVPFPADWKRWGRSAGPRRNAEMILENPDVVAVFPGGNGTADMERRATARAETHPIQVYKIQRRDDRFTTNTGD